MSGWPLNREYSSIVLDRCPSGSGSHMTAVRHIAKWNRTLIGSQSGKVAQHLN